MNTIHQQHEYSSGAMRPRRRGALVRTMIASMAVMAAAFAADSDTTMAGGNVVQPLTAPDNSTLSPADQAQAQSVTDQINTDLNLTFPVGADPNSASFDTIQARMNAKRMADLDKGNGNVNGILGQSSIPLYDTPFFGSAHLSTSLIASPSSYRSDREMGAVTHFDIIDGSHNMLGDVNRRLQRAQKAVSKFACGNFSWVAQLGFKFRRDALMNYVQALEANALPAAVMALIATWSPTLYEIIKWLRALATTELSADSAKCGAMEAAMTGMGQRMLRGPGYAQCMQANSNMDIGAAHQICDPGNTGTWDGVENWAGQIKSFGADTGSVDVVSQMGSFVAPSNYPQSDADAVAQRSQDVAAEQANLAANPMPGPEPTGEPAHSQWVTQMDAYNQANSRYNDAVSNQTSAQDNLNNNTSTWDSLRYAVSKNVTDLFGHVTMNIRGDLEFGKQPKVMIRLKLDDTSYRASLLLLDQLTTHFGLLQQRNNNPASQQDAFNASYRQLHIMLLDSLSHSWKNSNMKHEPFNDLTIDKMAYMYALSQATPAGQERTSFENVNRINEHLNSVMHYEVYAYASKEWEDNKENFLEAAKKYTVGGANPMPQVYDTLQKRADDNSKILQDGMNEWEAHVSETLPYINSFKLPTHGTYTVGHGTTNYGTPVTIPAMYTP